MSTDEEMERRWVAGELSKHPASEFTLWLRRKQADAWEEGYDAGHQDARAVQPTYPQPTPNPHRPDKDG